MKGKRHYIISLHRSRSVMAVIAGALVFGITTTSIGYELQHLDTWSEYIFHFFTILSNMFAAIGAIFMVPYAVEGIRKKRFVLPEWIVLLQYSGTVCVAITMVTTILVIFPFSGMDAFRGTNFPLHIVNPLLTIILFQCVETGVELHKRSVWIALIPYWVYMAVYYTNVMIIGKDNGGWRDIYHMASFWPAWISIVVMIIVGFLVAQALLRLHNTLCKKGRSRITEIWRGDMEDTELLIEAFGLGRYMGKHCDASDITVPLDIFAAMHERYGISVEALSKAFIKGAMDSIEGRDAE